MAQKRSFDIASDRKPKIQNRPKTEQDMELDNEGRPKIPESKIMMSWEAREFVQQDRSNKWYIIGGIILSAVIAYALLTKGYIMAITFVMLGIIVYMFSIKEPRTIKFFITEDGIQIDDKFYYFDDIESFWIIYKPPEIKTLNFRHSKLLIPEITVQLEDQDPVKIRELLFDYIPEDIEREESTTDMIARRLKF